MLKVENEGNKRVVLSVYTQFCIKRNDILGSSIVSTYFLMKHNDNESVLKSQMKILKLNFEDSHSDIFYQVLIILGILENFKIISKTFFNTFLLL